MEYQFNTGNWHQDLHLFSYKDLHILMDINSGAIHLVDQITKDVLDNLAKQQGDGQAVLKSLADQYPQQEIQEVMEELVSLEREGLLFTHDQARTPWNTEEEIIKSLCLHLAHDCNLRCRYCFAGTGEFGGPRELMSLDVGKKALDFLLANSGSRPSVEVDFFGGEPLMNVDVMKELVYYGEEKAAQAGKTIEFTLTTNGMLLEPELEAFLRKHKMLLVLSIDGRPEVNDYMRPMAGGQGSYDRIMANYQRLVRTIKPEDYYIRGTYTRHNLDFSQDVQHLHDQGFVSLSVEPVVASPQEDYAFREEDLPILFQEYDRLVDLYLDRQKEGQPFEFFHFNVDLEQGPCLPKRLIGCGAGFEYLAVTPEGELYPCHQFVGRSEYSLGHVEQGLINEEKMEEFRQAHIYNKKVCRQCWARFLCSGGCHANAHAHNGNILEPYEFGCQLQKKRLECAIYLECLSRLEKEG